MTQCITLKGAYCPKKNLPCQSPRGAKVFHLLIGLSYRASHLARRTTLTLPLSPPPRKNPSPPSDSSLDTPTPGGRSSRSRTSPVLGSIRLKSLSSPSQVPCQS